MRATTLLPRILAIGLGLGAGGGCTAELCPRLYDKLSECAPAESKDKLPAKQAFVDKCEADRKQEKADGLHDEAADKAIDACLAMGDCDAMQTCIDAESDKQYTKRQVAAIAAAKDSGDVEAMKDACQYIEASNATLVGACKDVMGTLLEATTAEVTKMRDAGQHDLGVCSDLQGYATSAGVQAESAAKALCTEAEASQSAAKAVTAAAAKVAAKDGDMPSECGAAVEALAKIDSRWAKDKMGEVVNACYLDLGLVVMEAKVPQMKGGCDLRVREIYAAVKEHGLSDPKMDEWMAKADPECAKADG